MIRTVLDTLPKPLNLVGWRYKTDPKCPFCRYHFTTTKHILNACPIALSLDCYTWRCDSILRKLLVFLRQHLKDKGNPFGDLRGFRVMEYPPSTVPIDIMPTSNRPDIVFISKDKEITIIELTVPFNWPDCINVADEYKFSKCQLLLSDLEAKNYSSQFVAIEISVLGHYLNRTCKPLNQAFLSIPKATICNLLDEAGKLLSQCHGKYFMVWNEKIWSSL